MAPRKLQYRRLIEKCRASAMSLNDVGAEDNRPFRHILISIQYQKYTCWTLKNQESRSILYLSGKERENHSIRSLSSPRKCQPIRSRQARANSQPISPVPSCTSRATPSQAHVPGLAKADRPSGQASTRTAWPSAPSTRRRHSPCQCKTSGT